LLHFPTDYPLKRRMIVIKKLKTFTSVIRKSEKAYVGVCLEVNVAAQGKNIPDVERNLTNAVQELLSYAEETNIEIEPMSIADLIEFFEDTSPIEKQPIGDKPQCSFHEIVEVPNYV
jgi:predicted RNase H-like HicB family nuclease